MTNAELAESKKALEAIRMGVYQALARREGIAIERSADASDEAQYAVERELTTRVLDRESRLLSNVKLALRRIESGNYGICQRCEGAIGAKRLAAVPWASYCIRCQEVIDQEQGAELEKDSLIAA